MTELSQQISRIRSQNLLSVAPITQGRPSLFLSAKEAAGIDIDQVYDAALNGLKTLSQYDGRLAAFQDGLLHQSSTTVQRELKTAAENQSLDKEISILLEHLSIFAAEPSTHLILEYLIRRYRAHELNSDALLRCLISTHDSKVNSKNKFSTYPISFTII
jgi:U3 small nucleolar RNA-associated protein 10